MTSTTSDNAYITKTTLHEREWTDAGIRRFLGPPDKTKKNPRYISSTVCLYRLDRVEAAERTPEFQKWLAGRRARGARASLAASRQSEALVDEMANWEPGIPLLPLDELYRRAIRAYNAVSLDQRQSASTDSDPQFLQRIAVNYVRHETSDYDAMLNSLRGRVGIRAATDMVRARVFGAIAVKYPALADEAMRQQTARECASERRTRARR